MPRKSSSRFLQANPKVWLQKLCHLGRHMGLVSVWTQSDEFEQSYWARFIESAPPCWPSIRPQSIKWALKSQENSWKRKTDLVTGNCMVGCTPMTRVVPHGSWTRNLHWELHNTYDFECQKDLMPSKLLSLVWCPLMTLMTTPVPHHIQKVLYIAWLHSPPYFEHQNVLCAGTHVHTTIM
jgi:hypothetical protein